MAYHKWSRHSPRNHRSPSILEQQERNREDEYQRQSVEHYKKAEAGKVVIREARANGLPLVVRCAGAAHEQAYLADVDAAGKLVVATPGFDKAPREFGPSDISYKPAEWTLENATPEVQAAWDRLQGPEMDAYKQRAHEEWTKSMAEAEVRRQRDQDRFRSSD